MGLRQGLILQKRSSYRKDNVSQGSGILESSGEERSSSSGSRGEAVSEEGPDRTLLPGAVLAQLLTVSLSLLRVAQLR